MNFGNKLLCGVRCVLGRVVDGTKNICNAGEVVVGINGVATDDLESGTQLFASNHFSAWLRNMNSVRPNRGRILRTFEEKPKLSSSKCFVDRTDQYFGVLKYEDGGKMNYLWHCSSQNFGSQEQRLRGKHIQLLGMTCRIETAGSSTSDVASGTTWHLEYPTELVLERDQGAHNMCLVDWETKSAIEDTLHVSNAEKESILTYGLGGQYDDAQRHFKFGLQIYALTKPTPKSNALFVQKKYLLGGMHPNCLELRRLHSGIGEFDGQSVLIYFHKRWLLFTRANCAEKGHRQVQVCCGNDLDSFGPFSLVSFAGVPLSADVYFAHVYKTAHNTLVAIIPMAESCSKEEPTPGGIYIAESKDGLNFGPPVLLLHSLVYQRRTADVPVHEASLVISKDAIFTLPVQHDARFLFFYLQNCRI